jgi:hypothetical protein
MAALPGVAATVTLDAVDSGFYFANGLHNPRIENYLTGVFTTEHRSFVVFDVSRIFGTINSATLRLFNPNISPFQPGYLSPDPTEILNIYDVTTPAGDITGNTAGLAGFDDLGSGTLYGTRVVSAADNGTVVETPLMNSAVAGLNAATGLFVLGGALGTIGTGDQYVFAFSMASFVPDHTRQLVLDVTPVPEPSTAAFIAIGALALVVVNSQVRFRRRTP